MDGIPSVMRQIAEWKDVTFSRSARIAFADEGVEAEAVDAIKPAFLLTARRPRTRRGRTSAATSGRRARSSRRTS